MKTRTLFLVSTIVIGLAAGFWLYGGARTMSATVNFDMTAFLAGLVFGFVLPLVVVLPPLLIAKKFWLRERVWPLPSWFVALAVCLLAGSLASEGWILRDEARFSAEVSKTNGSNPYNRARVWPNQTGSLVFVPGEGIHSTD